VLPLLLILACAPAPVEPTGEPLTAPIASPWQRQDVRPTMEGGPFARHPGLTDLSLFAGRVQDGLRPSAAERGAFGVGNGAVFAMSGLTDPLNTLHALVGPVLRKDVRFFGDVSFHLEVDGVEVVPTQEAIARPRGTGLVVTRGDAGGWTLETVDVAPRPAGVDPLDVPPVLVRYLVVRSASGAGEVSVRVDAWDAPVDVGGVPAGVDPTSGRHLGYVGMGGTEVVAGDTLTVSLGRVEAGGEAVGVVALVFADDAAGLADAVAEVEAADPEVWLGDTLAWWADWRARRTQIVVDDPWLTDWIDGLDAMVQVQTSSLGGVVATSRYTGTWLRDTIGPVRMWGPLGRHGEMIAAVDYLRACHAHRGDIGNSCTSGLRPEEIPAEPDWSALGPMSGRTAAEGPSHLPLMASEVARWTGDAAAIDRAWPWLKRSVLGQTVSEEGLQPFSGDETFRLAMGAALGYPLEWPWQDLAWSLNSSVLFLAASDWLGEEADRRGDPDLAAIDALYDRVDDGLAAFGDGEDGWPAFIFRDPEEPVEDRPFEDVNLAPIWSGALAPADPRAIANLEGLRQQAGHPDGSMQTPLAPEYDIPGMFVEGGAATGMVPGYVLVNEARTGSPWGPKAFAQLLTYASPSGQYDEAVRWSDRTAIMPAYDRGGTLGDVSARYRAWEGAINGHAALLWLLGEGPVAEGDGWTLQLAPRAPSGLERLEVRGLVVPGATVDVVLRWEDAWICEVTANGGDVPLRLELPLTTWTDMNVAIDGPVAGEVVRRPLGEAVVRYGKTTLIDGETQVYTVGQPVEQ
jgi:hypothetical protein